MQYHNNGGYKMPSVGIGTFLVTDEEELSRGLNAALECGYRHIDTATFYKNEHIIGNVLKQWISDGKLKREDIFVTTKLSIFDLFPDKVEDALKLSLEKLQLDYIDLYLIHIPIAFKLSEENKPIPQPTDLIGVWKKMEEQVDASRTRTIGVSNFTINQIERIQKIARIQPANLQIEMHVYFQQRELCDFANKNNITVVAYSPLGSPGRAQPTKSAVAFSGESRLFNILNDEVVKKIAEKYKKLPAQILLRFLLQLNVVVIPKSTNPKRLKENFDIFDFILEEGDMNELRGLDKGTKGKIVTLFKIPNITEHPEYPFLENI